jgi:hypothetical protein
MGPAAAGIDLPELICASAREADPLNWTDETSSAATQSAIVTALSRLGVIQPGPWIWSQLLAPLAPATAAIAHAEHIPTV